MRKTALRDTEPEVRSDEQPKREVDRYARLPSIVSNWFVDRTGRIYRGHWFQPGIGRRWKRERTIVYWNALKNWYTDQSKAHTFSRVPYSIGYCNSCAHLYRIGKKAQLVVYGQHGIHDFLKTWLKKSIQWYWKGSIARPVVLGTQGKLSRRAPTSDRESIGVRRAIKITAQYFGRAIG